MPTRSVATSRHTACESLAVDFKPEKVILEFRGYNLADISGFTFPSFEKF